MKKKIIISIVIVIIGTNIIAYFHAYKFTHFELSSELKTKNPGELSFSKKVRTLIFGISNPKPQISKVPSNDYQTIILESNTKIECWEISIEKAKGTIAIFHGFSGEKSSMLDKAEIFLNLNYNILLVDFMGSGGSDGIQTTVGFKEATDVKICTDYLIENGEKNIILFGTSMGSVAIMKAMKDYNLPVSSIIIECPFGTMLQTVKSRFKEMGLPGFPMAHLLVFWGGVQNGFNAFKHNPQDYALEINCPTLLLYGEKDIKVSKIEIENIYNNLNCRKELITYPLSGHENYLIKYKEKWTSDIDNFLSDQINPGIKKQ